MAGRIRKAAVLGCWLALALLPLRAVAAVVLDHAAVDVRVQGAAAVEHADQVPLPYSWNLQHGNLDGQARFTLAFAVADPRVPHALFIPRVGNTFEVWVNGTLVERMGEAGSRYQDFAKQPRYIRIPDSVLRPMNRVEVVIAAQGGRKGGLSEVLAGPVAEIEPVYAFQHRWLSTGLLVVAVASCVLGILAALLWLRQRDTLYLYYAGAELLWMLYLSDSLNETAWLPWPWWGILVYSAQVAAAVLIFKFALLAIDRHRGLLRRLLNWNLLLTPAFTGFALYAGLTWGEQFWKFITDSLSLVVIVLVVRDGIRHPELERRVLAIGLLLLAAVGCRDELTLVILPYLHSTAADRAHLFAQVAWTRYAWILFGITLAWIIAERMRKAAQALAAMNQTLAERLAARERELQAIFVQQAHAARQHATLEERQRLMRDMHDGIGSQLVGALQLALHPDVSREAVAGQLRDTLDHLRMTVDAMQDTEGDIATLLGALRYRLNPRLAAAGIELEWTVEPLPELPGWTLQHARDLQMILFEAFANLISHAGASRAAVHARWDAHAREVRIALRDNGCGFDATARAGGKGLANMRLRAERLGARLGFDSAAGGTAVTLVLPFAPLVQA
ncbi:MAG: sensor histidine kinase [Telluria sp.]